MNSSNITNPFEGSIVSLYIDPNSVYPQQQLDIDKELILSKLGQDKDYFLSWLSTINIKNVSSLKIETLDLLVSCWLACKYRYRDK